MTTKKIKINENITIYKISDLKSFKNKFINICNSIRDKKIKNILVPGGQTPIPLFKELAKYQINWSKYSFSVTDERLTRRRNINNSNELMFSHFFLKKLEKKNLPKFLTLPKKKIYFCKDYKKFTNNFVSFLGIGNDGHIASIFRDDFKKKNNKLIFFTKKKYHNYKRVSWTFDTLLKSKEIHFLISGRNKQELIENIKNLHFEIKLPYIQLIKKFRGNINIIWCTKQINE